MTLVKKLFVTCLAKKELDNMWKVIVIICAFGYECQLLEQNPMEYYHDYNECIVVSIEKEKLLTQLYRDYDYYVVDSEATCEQVQAT